MISSVAIWLQTAVIMSENWRTERNRVWRQHQAAKRWAAWEEAPPGEVPAAARRKAEKRAEQRERAAARKRAEEAEGAAEGGGAGGAEE